MAKATRIKTNNSFTRIEGIAELQAKLQSLADRSDDVYATELKYAANRIELAARGNIRDISGKLSSSLKVDKTKRKYKVAYRISAGGALAPHAHLVEFGHRMVTHSGEVVGDVPAHPFLGKAFKDTRDITEKSIEDALDKLLKG